jgi:hypothetical protein
MIPEATSGTITRSRPALRYGLRVGAGLLVIEIVHGVAAIKLLPLPATAVFFLIALAGLLFAGARGAGATGKVSTGAVAGLLAGTLLGVGFAIGTTIGAATNFAGLRAVYQAAAAQSHVAYSDSLVIAGTILTVALSFLVSLCAGAACGAVGGLIGALRGRRA